MKDQLQKARQALKRLLDRDMRNTCQHDNTHRGGVLWEICDDCGMKWADDRGGKPEWKDPPEWTAAEAALTALSQLEAMVGKQEPVLKVYKGDICYKSKEDDQSYGMWCPVSWEYQHGLPDGTAFYAAPVSQQPQAEPFQPDRANAGKGTALRAPELQAMRDLLAFHDELMDVVTVAQFERALAYARKEIAAGRTARLKTMKEKKK